MSYYAVRAGRVPGVYTSWGECSAQTTGFTGAVHKKFKTRLEANVFIAEGAAEVNAASSIEAAAPPPSRSSAAEAAKGAKKEGEPGKKCKCGVMRTVKQVKNGANVGKLYCRCEKCSFFAWVGGSVAVASSSSSSSSSRGAQKPEPLLRIYTDGACKGNNNVRSKVAPAGWGVVVYQHSDNSVVQELFGPVDLNPASPYFLHAEVGSNNTAELSALGECLLWVRDFAPRSLYPGPIVVLYDSEYAMKSIDGSYNGAKNRGIINHVRTVYQAVKKERSGGLIEFRHVKGHSGDVGNDRADFCAGVGSSGKRCHGGRFATPTPAFASAPAPVTAPVTAIAVAAESQGAVGSKRKAPAIVDLTGEE